MLATTPPHVKPQSRVYAVLAATGVRARIATGRLCKLNSFSGAMAREGLKSKCDGGLGTGQLQRRIAVELFRRSRPEVFISRELRT
jgi:rhodanese-related sulfurtransferase